MCYSFIFLCYYYYCEHIGLERFVIFYEETNKKKDYIKKKTSTEKRNIFTYVNNKIIIKKINTE
jgi:hypothetical protein